MITKTNNEAADVANEIAIGNRFSDFIPICISVRAITKEDIVTERASTPLISMGNDILFLFDVLSGPLSVVGLTF